MDQPAPLYPSRTSDLKRELFIVAAGISLVLGSAYAAWFLLFRQNAPDTVVRRFVEADRTGRFSDQQALIAKAWDSSMILDTVQAFRRQTGVSPFDKYRILSTSIQSETAQVDVEVTLNPPAGGALPGAGSATPNTMVVPFHLVREDRAWKIDPTRTIGGLMGVLVALGFQQLIPRVQHLMPPGFNPPSRPQQPAPPQGPILRFP